MQTSCTKQLRKWENVSRRSQVIPYSYRVLKRFVNSWNTDVHVPPGFFGATEHKMIKLVVSVPYAEIAFLRSNDHAVNLKIRRLRLLFRIQLRIQSSGIN